MDWQYFEQIHVNDWVAIAQLTDHLVVEIMAQITSEAAAPQFRPHHRE